MIAVSGQPTVNRSAVPSFRRSPVPSGFTLIEILVVITVIAILAGLVTPMVFRNVDDARETAARAQLEILGLALDVYRLHNSAYPTTAQGLGALDRPPVAAPAAPNWRGPYLRRPVPPDPWGHPYQYESPGRIHASSYDLQSLGRDGRPGGEGPDGDILAWENSAP
jgi:general secretion pathway protein G